MSFFLFFPAIFSPVSFNLLNGIQKIPSGVRAPRRIIYYPTFNGYSGDTEYFKQLCKPIQPKKQGDYNPEYMGVLLHYMKTQINTHTQCVFHIIRLRLIIFHTPKYFHGRNIIE